MTLTRYTSLPRSAMKKRKTVALRLAQRDLKNVRPVIAARSRGLCEMCTRPLDDTWELSHRIHRGTGGSRASWMNTPPNLMASCGGPNGCNQRLSHDGEFIALGIDVGWLLRRGQNPAAEAVAVGGEIARVDGQLEVVGGVWLYLDAAGAYQEETP